MKNIDKGFDRWGGTFAVPEPEDLLAQMLAEGAEADGGTVDGTEEVDVPFDLEDERIKKYVASKRSQEITKEINKKYFGG